MRPALSAALAAAAAGWSLAAAAPAEGETFALPSADGAVTLHGRIDPPDTPPAEAAPAYALMIPGSGPFDRDVVLGRSGQPGDRVFAAIAAALNAAGVGTLRYDTRVFTCMTEGDCDETAPTITPDSMREDIRALAGLMGERAAPRCAVALAHSEGALHAAAVLQEGEPPLGAFLGLGAPLMSPAAIYRWQAADRMADSLALMDADGDGAITHAELVETLPRTPVHVMISVGGLTPEAIIPAGQSFPVANLPAVRAVWTARYRAEREEALTHEDGETYIDSGIPYAAYSWRKMWFQDDTPVARRLAEWGGPARLLYDGLDSQTPPDLQLPALEEAGLDAEAAVLPELGHSFGRHVFAGPIETAALDRIVADVRALLAEAGCPGWAAPADAG